MQFDGGGTDGAEAARKQVGEGLVQGQGAAILQDHPVEFKEKRRVLQKLTQIGGVERYKDELRQALADA